MSDKNSYEYEDAITLLNTRKAIAKASVDDMRGSDDMVQWLELLGYSVSDLERFRPIHYAGTNGKGSSATFTECFLRAHGKINGHPTRTGLYTSPHVLNIRERICIDGNPISEDMFTHYFFEIWRRLPKTTTKTLDIPRYLQLLCLLSIHVFIREKVDVAIFEAHLGGKYDATNVIPSMIAAITPISLDHEHLLGPGLTEIARHKAGIIKGGSIAFSSAQPNEVKAILEDTARTSNVNLQFVSVLPHLPRNTKLASISQRGNCSLAIQVTSAWLGTNLAADVMRDGIAAFEMHCRFQVVHRGQLKWFIDGAHNIDSIESAVVWFTQNKRTSAGAILVFGHFSRRDGETLMKCAAESFERNDVRIMSVVLTTYEIVSKDKLSDRNMNKKFDARTFQRYQEFWQARNARLPIHTTQTINEAVEIVSGICQDKEYDILVIGSFKVAGGVLQTLQDS